MTWQFIIPQLTAILCAVYLARHDAPVANHFSDRGAEPLTIAKWHSNGFRLKFCLSAGIAALFAPVWLVALLVGAVVALWIFLVFDPVLNKARKRGFSWDYLSDNDGTGRWLLKRFGKRAGQIKALACLIGIIGINIIYYVLVR